MFVLRSKEKISRISVIYAFTGVVGSKENFFILFGSFQVFWGVGSERKISLLRRLPNFLFPHYRSKDKFGSIPVQRVAGGFSFVSLAKREKDRSQQAVKPLSGVILAKEKDGEQRAGSLVLFALCTEKPGQGQSAAY